jgi:hypothetical protein
MKEFSNDPTSAIQEISNIFQKKLEIVQRDLELLQKELSVFREVHFFVYLNNFCYYSKNLI